MDVSCKWMCSVNGCVGAGRGRTGCVQNEKPHIGEWWEYDGIASHDLRYVKMRYDLEHVGR